MKFDGGMLNELEKNPLKFGSGLDQGVDPGFFPHFL